jgi:hypothetical protein
MRAIAALTLWAAFLSTPVFEQTTPKTITFTNSDSAFRFVYPADFQVCTQAKIELCIHSFIPVCGSDSFVCVVYPAEQFKGTNFGAASFQVREIRTDQEMMTADVCVTPYPQKNGDTVDAWPEFMISAQHPAETIGGVVFVHGFRGDAATSHSLGSDLYRVFHKQRCFELSVSETETSRAATDPPMKTLTPTQRKRLDQAMSLILHSFCFSD